MTTFFVEGLNRTMIIDWVRTWSPVNLESLSEPSSKTVNEPGVRGVGLVDGVVTPVGEGVGVGITTAWLVASRASAKAGRKYAKPPDATERATAVTANVRMRKGLKRPCERRARWPGL